MAESSNQAATASAWKHSKKRKLKRITFNDRAGMKKLVDPVMAAYAKEIDALAVYEKINAA